MNLLDHHATLKKKTLRANNSPYITKKLRKTIDLNLKTFIVKL